MQIYQDLMSHPQLGPSAINVTQRQIWFWWKTCCSSSWQLDSDVFESVAKGLDTMLASADGPRQAAAAMEAYRATVPSSTPSSTTSPPPTARMIGQAVHKEGRVRGFALYAIGMIAALRNRTVEISMDATYGTNSGGHDLFGVLAEVDGTGIPLMYLFMDTKDMLGDGRRIEIISETLAMLKGMGINPEFVGCDKDSAEIKAIDMVWPEAKVQLCYWHVRQALRQRFANGKATSTTTYHAFEAKNTVPSLEPCWGTATTRRHSPMFCTCSCRSDDSWDKPGRLELRKEENEALVSFISRHFNQHPYFAQLSGVSLTSEQLRVQAATETYQYCKQRGWARVWAYLWTNFGMDHLGEELLCDDTGVEDDDDL